MSKVPSEKPSSRVHAVSRIPTSVKPLWPRVNLRLKWFMSLPEGEREQTFAALPPEVRGKIQELLKLFEEQPLTGSVNVHTMNFRKELLQIMAAFPQGVDVGKLAERVAVLFPGATDAQSLKSRITTCLVELTRAGQVIKVSGVSGAKTLWKLNV